VEIMAEIIIAVAWWIIQFIGEVLLQTSFEFIAELIVRSVKEPFRRPERAPPVLAAIWYGMFGVIAGAISLWIMPDLLISAQWLRVANLLLSPMVAGLLMERLGAWRRGRDQETIRLDTFAFGFVFAFTMALVRFTWGA
jgi:hypothetical protein